MDQNLPNGARVVRPAEVQQVSGLLPVDEVAVAVAEVLGPLDWCGHVPQGDTDEASARLARSEAQGWAGRTVRVADAAALLRNHADELDALADWFSGMGRSVQAAPPTLTAGQMRAAAQLVEDLAGSLPLRRRLKPGLLRQLMENAHRRQAAAAGPVDVQFVAAPRAGTVHGVGDAALSAEGMDDLRARVGATREDLAREHPEPP